MCRHCDEPFDGVLATAGGALFGIVTSLAVLGFAVTRWFRT